MEPKSAEYGACVICQHGQGVYPFCTRGGLQYVKCRQCGLVFVDRFADDSAMRGAYTGGWLKTARRRLLGRMRKLKHHKRFDESAHRARRIFEFAVAQMAPGQAPERFLDIGCNRGFLLAAGVERNADVYGIELVAEMMMPFCNTYPQFREQIFAEKLARVAPRLPDGFFNLVTAIDVIEHFEDPVADMREIHRMLHKDGVLVIQTPDADCAQAERTGCDWGALKPLEHLHLFGRRNFARFANAQGFGDVRIHEPFEHADGNFVAVLKK